MVKQKCPECGRVFDMADPKQAEDFVWGHNCEEES